MISEDLFKVMEATRQAHFLRNTGNDPTQPGWSKLPKQAISKAELLLTEIEREHGISCYGMSSLDREGLPSEQEINAITESEGGLISEEIQCETPITRQDFIECLAYAVDSAWLTQLDSRTKGIYLAGAIRLKQLARAYSELKRRYFTDYKEHLYAQIDGLSESLTSAQNALSQQEKENERLRIEYRAGLELTLSERNRRIANLQKDLRQAQSNNRELYALRDYIFSLQRSTSSISEHIEAPLPLPSVAAEEKWPKLTRNQ